MRRLRCPVLVEVEGGKPTRVTWSRDGAGGHGSSRSATRHGSSRSAARPGSSRSAARPGSSQHDPRAAASAAPADHDRPVMTRVIRVVDEWCVDSHWWANEISRDYYLLELDGGKVVEIYREGESWWLTGIND